MMIWFSLLEAYPSLRKLGGFAGPLPLRMIFRVRLKKDADEFCLPAAVFAVEPRGAGSDESTCCTRG